MISKTYINQMKYSFMNNSMSPFHIIYICFQNIKLIFFKMLLHYSTLLKHIFVYEEIKILFYHCLS